jgi:hypothetical protein
MSRLVRSLLASAAVAGVGYYLRNRRARTVAAPTRDRGVPIYDNHPIADSDL